MSDITKIAEKAADEIYGCVDTDGFGGIMFDRAKIAKIIEEAARAAIDAYESAKREAEKPWADALEEAWFQLNLKDGMKIDQARIHAKTRMNIALNTLGEVRP